MHQLSEYDSLWNSLGLKSRYGAITRHDKEVTAMSSFTFVSSGCLCSSGGVKNSCLVE